MGSMLMMQMLKTVSNVWYVGLNYLVTKKQSAAMSIFYKLEKKLKFLNCQNCKDE